ncbi:MAG: STAS domain-containing protein [Spirochaetia bacterium]
MDWNLEYKSDGTIICSGAFILENIDEIYKDLISNLPQDRLVLETSKIRDADMTFYQLLLSYRNSIGSVVLRGVPDYIEKDLRMTGLHKLPPFSEISGDTQ